MAKLNATASWERKAESQARLDSFDFDDPNRAYRAVFKDHREEIIYAMGRFIKEHHPDAEPVYKGSDMGGPIWAVEEAKTEGEG